MGEGQRKGQQTGHRSDFLGNDAIFPLLLKMGIPAAVGMIVNALYNIVDTIFVGQGVGPLAIAALSVVFPVQMIVSALAQAIGVGAASLVSRRLGERKAGDAAAVAGTAYAAVFAATAIQVALLLAFTEPILRFFGASADTMPYALAYTRIVGAGFFFFAMSMLASNLMRAEGNPRAAMTSMLLGAGMNSILDPILIFGFSMGVEGAAIATVASQMASCLFLLTRYRKGRSGLPLRRADFRIRPRLLAESAILGAPAFIQSAGMSILALTINTTLGRIAGDRAIGIYGMNHKVISIVIFPVLGIIQGFQPIAGYNFGARNFTRVRQSLAVTAMTAFGVSLVGYSFMLFAPGLLIRLFTTDQGLVADGARALRLMTLSIPLASLQILGASYFQATGKKGESLLLGVMRQFLILLPLVFTLPGIFGVNGVWMAFPMADGIATTITGILLARELRHLAAA